MTRDRRTLIDGIKSGGPPIDPQAVEEFVHGRKAAASAAPEMHARLPLTMRIRADYATTLKRVSLQRQIDGVKPCTLQDILEEALEPWLKKHEYIP